MAAKSAGSPDRWSTISVALSGSSVTGHATSAQFNKALALSSGSVPIFPSVQAFAHRALPNMTCGSAGPLNFIRVSIIRVRISATSTAGLASSSIRLTKIKTSRDLTLAMSRTKAMSIDVSACCADKTTTQSLLSRIALIVICSRIINVSFTPGVSRIHKRSGTMELGRKISADLVMSANRPWSLAASSSSKSSPRQT